MAVLRSRSPLTSLTLRQYRKALGLSQAQFAAELSVPLETYRTWDSGRRHVRSEVLTRANACALRHDPHASLPLDTSALLIDVHVRTLHAAAKDGRLHVTYDTRTTFRRLRRLAMLADAEYFLHAHFETAVWPKQRPARLSTRCRQPADAVCNTRR